DEIGKRRDIRDIKGRDRWRCRRRRWIAGQRERKRRRAALAQLRRCGSRPAFIRDVHSPGIRRAPASRRSEIDVRGRCDQTRRTAGTNHLHWSGHLAPRHRKAVAVEHAHHAKKITERTERIREEGRRKRGGCVSERNTRKRWKKRIVSGNH